MDDLREDSVLVSRASDTSRLRSHRHEAISAADAETHAHLDAADNNGGDGEEHAEAQPVPVSVRAHTPAPLSASVSFVSAPAPAPTGRIPIVRRHRDNRLSGSSSLLMPPPPPPPPAPEPGQGGGSTLFGGGLPMSGVDANGMPVNPAEVLHAMWTGNTDSGGSWAASPVSPSSPRSPPQVDSSSIRQMQAPDPPAHQLDDAEQPPYPTLPEWLAAVDPRPGDTSLASLLLTARRQQHPRFLSRIRTLENYMRERERDRDRDRERGRDERDQQQRRSRLMLELTQEAEMSERSPMMSWSYAPAARDHASEQPRYMRAAAAAARSTEPGPAADRIERVREAIQYLDQIRHAQSGLDDAPSTCLHDQDYRDHNRDDDDEDDDDDDDDFILGPGAIAPPTDCSWLYPGTSFTGAQHATHARSLHGGNGSGNGGIFLSSTASPYHRHNHNHNPHHHHYHHHSSVSPPPPRGISVIDPAVLHDTPATRISVSTTSGRRYWTSSALGLNPGGVGIREAGPGADTPRPAPATTTAATTTATAANAAENTNPSNSNAASSSSSGDPSRCERWPVRVTIHAVDYDRMTLSGTMEAYNIPDKTAANNNRSSSNSNSGNGHNGNGAHIVTFLDGEIVDFRKHTLRTHNFRAGLEVDACYWRALGPFRGLSTQDMVAGLLSRRWMRERVASEWILMRWKGRFPCLFFFFLFFLFGKMGFC